MDRYSGVGTSSVGTRGMNDDERNYMGGLNDDDDSALDPSEQTQRPIDNAFNQQRVAAWHPILDPLWFIVALFYFGTILIPTGFKIKSIQDEVVELRMNYDDFLNYTFSDSTNSSVKMDNNTCGIGNNFNMNRTCNLTFVTTQFMLPPILIHYELINFHQNHRNYFKSYDPYQLLGAVVEYGKNQDKISAKACKPMNKLGDIQLNPCGLIANTFFNDYFTLIEGVDLFGNPLQVIEDGIAWKSDVEYRFSQPEGFNYSECPGGCDDTTCCMPGDSCTQPYYNKKDGKCYRYFYPNDNKTQYLYETYPDIISPLEGVTNEHFIVWMRVAAMSNFRKLYGYIDQPIAPNTTITFQVNANYVVARTKGGKALVISTTSIFGGRNFFMYDIFINVGIFCMVMGVLFSLKHFLKPRKIADPKYLHFKED